MKLEAHATCIMIEGCQRMSAFRPDIKRALQMLVILLSSGPW